MCDSFFVSRVQNTCIRHPIRRARRVGIIKHARVCVRACVGKPGARRTHGGHGGRIQLDLKNHLD